MPAETRKILFNIITSPTFTVRGWIFGVIGFALFYAVPIIIGFVNPESLSDSAKNLLSPFAVVSALFYLFCSFLNWCVAIGLFSTTYVISQNPKTNLSELRYVDKDGKSTSQLEEFQKSCNQVCSTASFLPINFFMLGKQSCLAMTAVILLWGSSYYVSGFIYLGAAVINFVVILFARMAFVNFIKVIPGPEVVRLLEKPWKSDNSHPAEQTNAIASRYTAGQGS